MRDDPSQKIIGVSASGFCLKERLGNLRNVIDQNSDEMRIAMIAMQDLGIDRAKLNVNGGATALGHPIGASGARVLTTLLAALQARGGKKGVASLCIGGGEATAVAVEMA